MRILEARDGFIRFESDEKLALSSFLQIDGFRRYIAQVVKLTRVDLNYIGYAKLIFVYDGSLNEYDNSLPDVKSDIRTFSFDILSKSMETDTPVMSGCFLEDETPIYLDKKYFEKGMLISIDNNQNLEKLIANFKQEFMSFGNVLVIDMLGITSDGKYTAAVDFKLPLNTESLDFIYEDCLNDATSDSKSLVKEIFADLAEYSRTVPFLPFATLKTIVDDMVEHSHVFKLLVLKNKLSKFDNLNYFAKTPAESENLDKILSMKDVVLDLSKLDSQFQNRYLNFVYSALKKLETKPQVFVLASNAINKKSLKDIIINEDIPVVFATHSRFKYINEIKSMFNNYIIEPSFVNNEVFKLYKTFLDAMPKDTYLLAGAATNYIPLISYNREFVNHNEEVVIEESLNEDVIEQDYSELEEALEITVEKDAQTEAIDKKSEDLIEKVAEDLDTVDAKETLNIFDDEDNEESTEEETDSEEKLQDEQQEILIEQGDFTVVHSVEKQEEQELEEVENVLETTEPELNDETVETPDEVLEVVDEIEENVGFDSADIAEDIEEYQEPETEILTEELEVSEDIIELAEEAEAEFGVGVETYTEEQGAQSIEPEFIDNNQVNIANYEIVEGNTIEEDDENSIQISQAEAEADLLLSLEDDVVSETSGIVEKDNTATTDLEEASSVINNNVENVELEVMSISDDEAFDEIVELDASEITEDDIIVDFGDDEIESGMVDPDALEKEIAEDVDKVFTTIKDDTISDSDLDFIDELNNDSDEEVILEEISDNSGFEEIPGMVEDNSDDILEPLQEINELSSIEEDDDSEVLQTRNASTPMVPVYEAEIPQEDLVVSDSFEQGDTVTHAKYGVGVVEKMIKYGAKTLYSINFDNVGRRLLDPTLTEIKKA